VAEIDSDLQAQLLNMCTRDGTPGQARSAVYTMAALMDPSKTKDASKSGNRKGRESLTQEKQQEAFGSLLKSLTLPSRLTLMSGSSDNSKIISILTALAALAESAPALFVNDNRVVGKSGEKAIKFALELCLLGRGPSVEKDHESEESEDDEEEEELSESEMAKETPKRRRSRKSGGASKNMTPDGAVSAVEDETLSLTCRRLCAAIEFLVSYIRHAGGSKSKGGATSAESTVPEGRVEQAFSILSQIIEDGGLPPATRDRRQCKSRQDRAALRKCAATHLLRLCDARLKLEQKFLTPERWHILSRSLLDEERSVRDGVMEELSMMLMGTGAYGQDISRGRTMPPSLRFVAMVTLCTDVDHGAGHSGANANAANVGKRSVTVKTAAMQCVSNLRKTSDATLAQCRSRGAAAEHRFESYFKMLLMPEYSVPYALHLLSFRRETPSAGGYTGSGLTQPPTTQPEEEAFVSVDEENQHKVLRKRLKWLFEPLVHSLGDGADNISFLLRMVDLLGNNYQPTDFGSGSKVASSPMSANSLLSGDSVDKGTDAAFRSTAIGAAKLKTICVAAREVLLSFVKKDVNLTPYPGSIQLPRTLFRRSHTVSGGKVSLSQQSGESARTSLDSSATVPRTTERKRASNSSLPESILTSGRKKSRMSRLSPTSSASLNRDSLDSTASIGTDRSRRNVATQEYTDSPKRNSLVHFSPDLVQRRSDRLSQDSSAAASGEVDDVGFAEGMSPIAKSQSPSPPPSNARSDASEEKTLGTTPPSILRTAHDEESDDGDLRLSMESEKSESTTGSRHSTLRSARRKAEPTVAIESEETTTTSETPLSVDPDDDGEEESHSSEEKRKLKREASTRAKKKSKKEASPPAVKIEINRGVSIGGKEKKSTSTRRGRKAKESNSIDHEFDFSDDDKNKENSTATKGRSRKKQTSSPAKKKAQKTKISMGKPKTTKRTRRT